MGLDLEDVIKKAKLKKLKTEIEGVAFGELIICPECKYISDKNKRGSATIFKNGNFKALKCFACGIWRRID